MEPKAVFVAWRSGGPSTGHWGPVGRLDMTSAGTFRFLYTRGARTLEGFEPFPGMPLLDEVYESVKLFPLFANRLLAKSRPEYEAYLRWGGFAPTLPPDPIALLAVMEGRRATDSVEVFPCPTAGQDGMFECTFFLHGIRWTTPQAQEWVGQSTGGEQLDLQPDNANEAAPKAVGVWTRTSSPLRIGYVPRYLARDIRRLDDASSLRAIDLRIYQVNADAPLQQRLLCRFRTKWPTGFEPCTGEEFEPIPDASALAVS
ncbi:MAG: hypothetical protein PWP23_2793 [Candidatus Sumerlaeota bacterium]|nr:hypothetical protein [Candidatus Sumerlaeota bacterium]